MAVNWCTSCKCVLANEEVVNGKCERCKSDVVRKNKSQWMLKITQYADRLIDDLDDVDYIKPVKIQQKNWIGRSHGAQVEFETTVGDKLYVYTTRPDTLFGSTYMVISPEHPFIDKWKSAIENMDEIMAYRLEVSKKSEFERSEISKDKTGLKINGIRAINPANAKEIPIYVSDYVLMSYGTGAIMAVPAHDSRDYEFAKKFNIEIVEVVAGGDIEKEAYTSCSCGKMINSEFLDGLTVQDAQIKMIKWLEQNKKGRAQTNYKLRDWVFARQRYWGEPIPIVYCDKCGAVAVSEEDLPIKLPDVGDFEPTDDGESPLSKIDEFVNTKCPKCGGDAKRETDTMPQWAGSSWYYLRYCDPKCEDAIASAEELDYWLPVDWYNGGMEHTTLHLLYSRFWHKFLYDIGVVSQKEPYSKRTSHGMILGQNGEKMSKSRGNVVNPDEIVDEYGADTMRLYEMFMGDFEKSAPWSSSSIKGCKRFLDRMWALQEIVDGEEIRKEADASLNKMIKKVTDDIENMKFNTAISAMMTFLNEIYDLGSITNQEMRILLILLSPFAPHISEELYEIMGFGGYVHEQKWPEYDPDKCKDENIEIVLQICGKIKSRVKIPVNLTKEEVLKLAKQEQKMAMDLRGKRIIKEIYVENRLVNIVAK